MLGLNQISLAVNRLLGPGDDAVLNLNFLSGTLDSRITFTRASTATRYNSSGLLETVASGVPRFDYDPVTLAPRGLLIEESRTNLHINSATLANYTTVDGASVSVGTGGTPSSGSGNYTQATVTPGNSAHYFQQAGGISFTAGTSYTYSIEVKYVDHRWIGISWYDGGFLQGTTFDLLNGSIGANTGNNSNPTITSLGSGRYRICVTRVAGSTATAWPAIVFLDSDKAFFTLTTSNLASATKVDVTFVQVEVGSFATSYIPTTTTAVTRAVDNAVMTGTNFSSWYNQTEGTFVADADMQKKNYARLCVASDNAGARHLLMNFSNNFTGQTDSGYSPVASIQAGVITDNVPFKGAFAYKANNSAACKDAGTVGTNTSNSSLPTAVTFYIGSEGGSDTMCGHIARIRYYNTRKSNSELQSLTA